MSTSYDEVYKRFLDKIDSIDIVQSPNEEGVTEEDEEYFDGFLLGLLNGAIPNFLYTTKNLEDRDDSTKVFNNTLSEVEKHILSHFMVVEYLNPKIIKDEFTEAKLGSKDFREFSPANMLNSLRELRDTYKNEAIDLMNVNYYFNAYGRK